MKISGNEFNTLVCIFPVSQQVVGGLTALSNIFAIINDLGIILSLYIHKEGSLKEAIRIHNNETNIASERLQRKLTQLHQYLPPRFEEMDKSEVEEYLRIKKQKDYLLEYKMIEPGKHLREIGVGIISFIPGLGTAYNGYQYCTRNNV